MSSVNSQGSVTGQVYVYSDENFAPSSSLAYCKKKKIVSRINTHIKLNLIAPQFPKTAGSFHGKVYSTHTKILIKLNETLEELQQHALRHLRAIILVFQQALITNGHYPQKMKTKSKRGSSDREQTKQRFLEQDRIAAECASWLSL